MQENELVYQINMENEIQRAKWFKEDLEKSGWREVYKKPDETFWVKSFSTEEVKTKILFKFIMPIPADMFMKLLHPTSLETRRKWDNAFKDHQLLETLPNNSGYITYMRAVTPWPLADRDFVLFIPPVEEIDWFGQKSLFLVQKNALHKAKPIGQTIVRATNGGNFFIATPDEKQPNDKCEVFGLTNNSYNGWLPNYATETIIANSVPRAFSMLRSNIINGYNQQIADK